MHAGSFPSKLIPLDTKIVLKMHEKKRNFQGVAIKNLPHTQTRKLAVRDQSHTKYFAST